MSYLALARRERPQRFEDVVGQEHIVRTLQNAIANDRVHHAYLFCGTRGVGKTSTARILAKALNCEQGPAAEPCNACRACTEITEGGSVDVIEIDAATHRGVEEAQRFLDGVQYRPVKDRFKFYIVDEVHMMTRHAFNALLKTFEEPPGHVKFVLATTEAHQVPGTILSRCQRFDFRELAPATIEKRLAQIVEQEGIGVSARSLGWVVREARGSMRDAQSLLDQVLAFAAGSEISDDEVSQVLGRVDSQHVEAAVDALATRNPAAALETVSEVAARGHDLKAFLAAILDALRTAMVAKACPADGGGDARAALTAEEAEAHAKILADSSVEDIVRWIDQLLRCQSDLQRAEDPRLTLETAVVRAATLAPVQPFANLLAEVRGLAAGIEGGDAPTATRRSGPERGTAAAPTRPRRAPAEPDEAPEPPQRAAKPKAEPAAQEAAPQRAAPPEPPPADEPPPGHPAAQSPPPDEDRVIPGDAVARIQEKVGASAPLVGRYLRRAVMTVNASQVSIHAKGSAALHELKEPEAHSAIAAAAREVLGRNAKVVVEAAGAEGSDGAPETGTARREAPRADRKLRSDVLADPVTKEALELWPGAEITDVKRLDGGDDNPGERKR